MSEIFGKIFGKDKHQTHKDKHSNDKGATVAHNTKWNDFCEYLFSLFLLEELFLMILTVLNNLFNYMYVPFYLSIMMGLP